MNQNNRIPSPYDTPVLLADRETSGQDQSATVKRPRSLLGWLKSVLERK